MTCGQRIKREREKRHMSQENLAEKLEVSRQAVSKWEADAARPTLEKRERLSQLFELPMEVWEDPPDPEQISLRRWKIATAALAAALCIMLAAGFVLFFALRPDPISAGEDPPENTGSSGEAEGTGIVDLSSVFPEALELKRRRDYDFGHWLLGEYDPALVPFLKDDRERQEQELWSGYFPTDHDTAKAFLSVVKTNPRWENGTTFYDVYVLYAIPEHGDVDWNILYRMAEENHYVGDMDGGLRVEKFSNVLGQEGFKISVIVGAAGYRCHYIILGEDGIPCLMAANGGMQIPVEFDVDEDGEKEIISAGGLPLYWEIIDIAEGEEGAFVYTLSPADCGVSNLQFAPEMGGYVVADSQDTVLARYVLRDGVLARLPMTDFTALDYPDAVGTKITFVTDFDILSDGRDPDDVLYAAGGIRITHRQQAYLALQELYNLTGLTVEECYCAARERGVIFSLLPDGFNQRSFYSMDFSESYSGSGIPGLYIAWQELGNDWSPLSLAEAVHPESWVAESDLLRWYYERLDLFSTGEAAYANLDELYLTNGDSYLAEFHETEQGKVLGALHGPYPGGVINH